jgi:hypothetical protein
VCTSGIPTMGESCPLEWLEALEAMEGMDVEVLVPGHGKIGNMESIKQFRVELTSLLDRIKEKIDQGLGKEEVVREMSYKDTVHAGYPPAFTERFNNHIKNSIRRVYDALAQGSS